MRIAIQSANSIYLRTLAIPNNPPKCFVWQTFCFPGDLCLKNPKRKRRLAYARSGLMINFAGSKESEYWSFPLPPFSPRVSTLKTSASSVDVRALKSQVKVQSRGGCCALHDLHVHVPPPKKDGWLQCCGSISIRSCL